MDFGAIFLSSLYTGIILVCGYWAGKQISGSLSQRHPPPLMSSVLDALILFALSFLILRILPNPAAYLGILVSLLILAGRARVGRGWFRKPHPLLKVVRDPNKVVRFAGSIASRAPGSFLGGNFHSVIQALREYCSEEVANRVARGMDTGFRELIHELDTQDPEAANVILALYTAADEKQISNACEALNNYITGVVKLRLFIRVILGVLVLFLAFYSIFFIYVLNVLGRAGF